MEIIVKLDTKIIKIESNLISIMNSYKQKDKKDCEAGGILIGRENKGTGNLIIEYITVPYEKDRRGRFFYHRKDERHIEFYNNLYNTHKGIYAYVGEWHTHPQDYPKYSYIDIKNWKRISRMNTDREKTYYHLIVGIKEIRIWEFRFNYKKALRVY